MPPLIVAHRGASYLAPENTLVAFRTAKALGADGIEMDVQMTKDKKLVIAHDFVTDRVSNAHYDIFDTDFETLRQLDFGSWRSPDYAGDMSHLVDAARFRSFALGESMRAPSVVTPVTSQGAFGPEPQRTRCTVAKSCLRPSAVV